MPPRRHARELRRARLSLEREQQVVRLLQLQRVSGTPPVKLSRRRRSPQQPWTAAFSPASATTPRPSSSRTTSPIWSPGSPRPACASRRSEKTTSVLAMILDHHGIQPNPARDPRVKLPREEKREVSPPSAEHGSRGLCTPAECLQVPAARAGWDRDARRRARGSGLGDVDETRGRWRVRAAVAKTGAARWVSPPEQLFAAVSALVPRDDRVPERPVFGGFGADRFRTALARACTGAGVPSFPPHDLRHRSSVALARTGALMGADRGVRRAWRPRHDRQDVHARSSRRTGARLRRAHRVTPPGHATRAVDAVESSVVEKYAAPGVAKQAGRAPVETRARRGDGSAGSVAEAGWNPLPLRNHKRNAESPACAHAVRTPVLPRRRKNRD